MVSIALAINFSCLACLSAAARSKKDKLTVSDSGIISGCDSLISSVISDVAASISIGTVTFSVSVSTISSVIVFVSITTDDSVSICCFS